MFPVLEASVGPHAAPFRQASSRAALLAGARSALQMRWGIRKVGGPTAGELAEMRRRAFAIGGGASGALFFMMTTISKQVYAVFEVRVSEAGR